MAATLNTTRHFVGGFYDRVVTTGTNTTLEERFSLYASGRQLSSSASVRIRGCFRPIRPSCFVLCSLTEEVLPIRHLFAHRIVLLWACIGGCSPRPEVPRSEPDNSAGLSSSPAGSDQPCLLGKTDPTVSYVPLRAIVASPDKYVGSAVRLHGAFLFERERVSLWGRDGGFVFLDLSGIKASTVSELEGCLHKIIALEGEIVSTRGSAGDLTILKVTSMYSTSVDAGVQAPQSRTDAGDVSG